MAGNERRMLAEERYLETRGDQLLATAGQRGISRRALIGAAAAGVPLLAGASSIRDHSAT